jgi:uncharacterized protein (TIGR02996 family)
LNEEVAFLDAIRKKPGDDVTRLVYADWLDEQGGEANTNKSKFLRVVCRLAGLADGADEYESLRSALRELAKHLDKKWVRVVCTVPIELCCIELEFAYECPKQWHRLRPTAKDNVRYCEACAENVYYCTSLSDARKKGGFHCVAIDPRLSRRSGDLSRSRRVRMGRFLPPRLVPPLDE